MITPEGSVQYMLAGMSERIQHETVGAYSNTLAANAPGEYHSGALFADQYTRMHQLGLRTADNKKPPFGKASDISKQLGLGLTMTDGYQVPSIFNRDVLQQLRAYQH